MGDYPGKGFLPQAVVNFIALLGWSPKSEQEVFSMDDLIGRFSLEAVNRAPARFNIEKCAWLNQQHLARLTQEEFAVAARPFVENAGLPITPDYPLCAASVQSKVRLLTEVPDAISFLLLDHFAYEAEALDKVRVNASAPRLLENLAAAFAVLNEWSGENAKHQIGEVAKASGVKPGQLMFPLRVALSGRLHGPDLDQILAVLGRERSVARIASFVGALTA